MYFLDILGTFAFSVTGAFKARTMGLNVFSVIFLGIITAVGGGTFRDLIIGRTPLFYLQDSNYLIAAVIGAIATYFIPHVMKKHYSLLRFFDSLGLAVFVIIGTSIASEYLYANVSHWDTDAFLSSILVGMITGFGGGVIREAVMGEMSFAFKKESNYLLAAFAGSASFYLITLINKPLAVILSITITLFLREVVSRYGIYQRVFKKRLSFFEN